jgi:hypothetical protein
VKTLTCATLGGVRPLIAVAAGPDLDESLASHLKRRVLCLKTPSQPLGQALPFDALGLVLRQGADRAALA